MTRRGAFIVVEGIRGSGKSTLINRAQEEFPEKDFLYVQDLGGSHPVVKRIRDIFLSGEGSPETLILLSCAARVELQKSVIEPALKEGRNVLCERWVQSMEAYLLYPNGVGPAYSQTLRNALGILHPDVTIIRSLDWEEAQERLRLQSRPLDVFERQGDDFMRKVCTFYNGYGSGLRADTVEVGLDIIREVLASRSPSPLVVEGEEEDGV